MSGVTVSRSTIARVCRSNGMRVANVNRLAERAAIVAEKRERGENATLQIDMIVGSAIVYLTPHNDDKARISAERRHRQFFIACFNLKIDCKSVDPLRNAWKIDGEISAIETVCHHKAVISSHFVGRDSVPRPVNDNRREVNPFCPGPKTKKHKKSIERLRAGQERRAIIDTFDGMTHHEYNRVTGQALDTKRTNKDFKNRAILRENTVKASKLRMESHIDSTKPQRGAPPVDYSASRHAVERSIQYRAFIVNFVDAIETCVRNYLDNNMDASETRAALYGERPPMTAGC